MKLNTEKDIIQLVRSDDWMMEILHAARGLNLTDWWVCAGFVRTKIWDTLHSYEYRTPMADVDVIYFDPINIDETEEKAMESELLSKIPDVPWSVKNQARMHLVNDIHPYSGSVDAMSKFPETATALGLKIDDTGQLLLAAPCGIDDALNLEVKPTPYFLQSKELLAIYEHRLINKNWQAKWNKIKITHPDEHLM